MEKELNEIKYFLTLRIQRGQELKIDLAQLSVADGFSSTSLEDIDRFTLNFTHEELLKQIIDDNLAGEYIMGSLCITDNANHRPIPVFTKDYIGSFNIYNYIMENIHNKNLMSNLNNKYQNLTLDIDAKNKFKKAIQETNVNDIFMGIKELKYLAKRELVCYIIASQTKKTSQTKERKLDKAA